MHESVYIVVAVRTAVDTLPLRDLLPDQPSDAVQLAALVEDQLRVEVLPLTIVLGFAEIVTDGAGELTDTVADCEALPPWPAQVKV